MDSSGGWYMPQPAPGAASVHAQQQPAPAQQFFYATAAQPTSSIHSMPAQPQSYAYVINPGQPLSIPQGSSATASTPFVWVQQSQAAAAVPQPYFISGAAQQPQPLYVMQPSGGSHPVAGGSMPSPMSMSIPSFVFQQGHTAPGSLEMGGALVLTTPSTAGSVPPHHLPSAVPTSGMQRKSMVSSIHTSNNPTSNSNQLGHYPHGPLTHESEQPDPNVIHSVRPFLAPKSSIGSILDTPSKLPLLDTLPPLARRRPPPMQLPAREAM